MFAIMPGVHAHIEEPWLTRLAAAADEFAVHLEHAGSRVEGRTGGAGEMHIGLAV